MAYDFLGLVNDVNRRVNEVELTSANFDTAQGFYNTAKDAVNSAIRQINYEQFEWPFNHQTHTETLVDGTTRYDFPATAKTVDMDTFRVKRNTTFNNQTNKLNILSYEEYLERYADQEYNTDSAIKGAPTQVFRTPAFQFGIVPLPDNAYEVEYEYYELPIDLSAATDTTNIPEHFRSIIIDGAMTYVYLFRGNSQDAALMQQKFVYGINSMRTIYINRTEYVRTSMIERVSPSYNFVRIK